jgi:hypothetical protein
MLNRVFLPSKSSFFAIKCYTPLNYYLHKTVPLDLRTIVIMCEADKNIVKQIYRDDEDDDSDGEDDNEEDNNDDDHNNNVMLPLHMLLKYKTFTSNVSVEADYFSYLLNLYPAAASIKDRKGRSLYNWAARKDMDVRVIRLLLNADRAMEPERRHNLNYAARRDAMFLSFRALSSNHQPSIWIKLRVKELDLLKHVISCLLCHDVIVLEINHSFFYMNIIFLSYEFRLFFVKLTFRLHPNLYFRPHNNCL